MNMKKLISMVLALVMLLSMMAPAMADEETYTLTLTNATAGHTYTAYQIFAGDLHEGVLSNIVWGDGVSKLGQTEMGNAADRAAALVGADAKTVDSFAAEVANYLGTEAGSASVAAGVEGTTTVTIPNLKAGYYLVQTTVASVENGVYTKYILKIVEDETVAIKADVPEVEKTVDDNDENIGDTVTFTLTATMPSTLQGYETYKVIFHDTLSAGLAYANNLTVTIDGVTIPATKTETVDGEEVITYNYVVTHENGILTVSFADVKVLGAKESSKIVVTYNAIVDDDAVIGTDGNQNKVYLEYSNNPNAEGTGKTPEDEVKVYTWEIPVFKYTMEDAVKTPLAGAGFTLYKEVTCETAVNLVATDDATIFKVCTQTDCTDHTHVTEIVTGTTGKFEIEGLEQGTYYLKETTTPAGFNTLAAPVKVTIGESGALTQDDIAISGDVEIQNNAGATLPETGAQGTKMIYMVGGILVAAAAVLLITKRRMNAAE